MLERRKIFSIHRILKKKVEASPLSLLDTKASDSLDNKVRDTHVSWKKHRWRDSSRAPELEFAARPSNTHRADTGRDQAVSGADHGRGAPYSFEGSIWGGGGRAQLLALDGYARKESITKIVLISIKFKFFSTNLRVDFKLWWGHMPPPHIWSKN
jgi:hypothetical protein